MSADRVLTRNTFMTVIVFTLLFIFVNLSIVFTHGVTGKTAFLRAVMVCTLFILNGGRHRDGVYVFARRKKGGPNFFPSLVRFNTQSIVRVSEVAVFNDNGMHIVKLACIIQ